MRRFQTCGYGRRIFPRMAVAISEAVQAFLVTGCTYRIGQTWISNIAKYLGYTVWTNQMEASSGIIRLVGLVVLRRRQSLVTGCLQVLSDLTALPDLVIPRLAICTASVPQTEVRSGTYPSNQTRNGGGLHPLRSSMMAWYMWSVGLMPHYTPLISMETSSGTTWHQAILICTCRLRPTAAGYSLAAETL